MLWRMKWYKTPKASTTKIRVTSTLHGKEVVKKVVDMLVQYHEIIDNSKSDLSVIYTKPPRPIGRLIRYVFEFEDSIVIVYSQAAYVEPPDPLNPRRYIDWQEIQKGRGTSDNWIKIKNMAEAIPNTSLSYNRQ
jgi:hypothetical protein